MKNNGWTREGRGGFQPRTAGNVMGSQSPPPPGQAKAAPTHLFCSKITNGAFKTNTGGYFLASLLQHTRSTRLCFNHHELLMDAPRCFLPSWGSARCLQAPEESSDEGNCRRASSSCSEEKCFSFLETPHPTKASSARHNEGITLCR